MSRQARVPEMLNRKSATRMKGVDNLLKEPTVKSVTHALQMTEELSEFFNHHGNEKLSNTLLKVSDILKDLKFREPRKQTLIDSYFLPT